MRLIHLCSGERNTPANHTLLQSAGDSSTVTGLCVFRKSANRLFSLGRQTEFVKLLTDITESFQYCSDGDALDERLASETTFKESSTSRIEYPLEVADTAKSDWK
jgi:hypothetical protein